MNKPLVSIITPAYNCAKYIEETINSVITQDYGNFEYYVIDDGSIDKTRGILKRCEKAIEYYNINTMCNSLNKLAEKVEVPMSTGQVMILGIASVFTAFATPCINFNVIRQKNIGEQRTVNKSFNYVTGKYFMIVNADDPLLPKAVSHLVEFMEQNPDVLCAYPDWESINEDGSHRAYIKCRDYDFKYMINHHTCLPSVGSMFRSSVLKTIRRDVSYRWLGDFDFWLKVGFAGPMAHVPQTLATWRNRDGQASKDKSDLRAKEHIRIASPFSSEARCWSYLVAAAVTDSKLKMLWYLYTAFCHYPQIVMKIDFWDALIKRAYHILRR